MEDFMAAFRGQASALEEQITTIEFELWDDNVDLFEIYQILKNWSDGYGALNPLLAKDLILGRNLPFEDSLLYLPYLHNGYCKITMKKQEKTDDRKNS